MDPQNKNGFYSVFVVFDTGLALFFQFPVFIFAPRRSAEEWKNRFYIVFEGEEGQDVGGLLREWYVIISREIFNPNYALFKTSTGDRVTYTINDFSHINSNHLCYFKFVGRVIAKAIYDNKLLECYFTRSFYKHILAKAVRYQVSFNF